MCENAVRFPAAARLVNCCLEMSWRNAHRLDKLATSTQLTHSQSTEYKEGGVYSSRRPHNAATLPGHRESPNCVDYNLVNEQEQSQPQRIHARHQGTQSPQISVTLILYHASGAEVLARRLIGTCTQMEPITENVTTTPPVDE